MTEILSAHKLYINQDQNANKQILEQLRYTKDNRLLFTASDGVRSFKINEYLIKWQCLIMRMSAIFKNKYFIIFNKILIPI